MVVLPITLLEDDGLPLVMRLVWVAAPGTPGSGPECQSGRCRRNRIAAVRGGRSSSTSASWLARMRRT